MSDADPILKWPLTQQEWKFWCGSPQPLNVKESFEKWYLDSDSVPYVVELSGEVYAYGELWVERDEHSVEIARIIVSPSQRRIGIASFLIKNLINEARHLRLKTIVLRVFFENSSAIKCYEASGFCRAPEAEQAAWNEGQPHPYQWMILRKTII